MSKSSSIELGVFVPALLLVVATAVPLVVAPEAGREVLGAGLTWTTQTLGPAFLWFAFAAMALLIWTVFSRHGSRVLGPPGEPPAFSRGSWFGMLFCAGLGSSLLYWGTIEWAYYFRSPPLGIEAESAEAARWAGALALFHWGLPAWSIYAVATIPIAWVLHIHESPVMRLSAACRGVLGDAVDGPVGKLIDVLFMFGLIGGVGTSLGLGVPMISEGVATLLQRERSFGLDVTVLALLAGVFATSVGLGLEKGIRRLSDINMVLAILLGVFVFLAGPTVFIMNAWTDNMGLMLDQFLRLSLRTDAIEGGGFPQKWTIFYWAWWIAFAPFMGLFVARISRGRTIRELILGEVIGGSLGCWAAFAVLGNTALRMHLDGTVPVLDLLEEQGAPQAIVAVISALPLGASVLAVFSLLAFIFVATSLDSGAFTLAAVSSKEMTGTTEPARWHRLLWAFVLGGVSLTLMFLGGLEALQAAAVLSATPVLIIVVLSVLSWLRWIRGSTA